MRSFPSAYAAAKNTLSGSAPVWYLAITDGTTTWYLSDRVVNVKHTTGATITTVAWVSSWGSMREGISNTIGEFAIGELRVHLLNDPNAAASIIHIIDNHDIETNQVVLCCWFEDITDPAQVMFTGYVKEFSIDENDAGVDLVLQDKYLKSDNTVGIVASKALLGNAVSKSDIGKTIPIVFGSVKKVPAIGAIVPLRTTLLTEMALTTTSISLSDITGFAVGMLLQIDAERVYISAISGSACTVTRAYDGTKTATHDRGTVIVQAFSAGSASRFTYIATSHAVTSITKVWARLGEDFFDISSLLPADGKKLSNGFTGQNWATINLPAAVSVRQLADARLAGAIKLITSLHSHTTGSTTPSTNHTASPLGTFTETWDIRYGNGTDIYYTVAQAWFPDPGTLTSSTVTATISAPSHSYIYFGGKMVYYCSTAVSNMSISHTFNTSTEASAMQRNDIAIDVWVTNLNTYGNTLSYASYYTRSATIHSASRSCTYTAGGTVTTSSPPNVSIDPTSSITLDGSMIAATLYENGIYCDITNDKDTPKEACEYLLSSFGGGGTVTLSGAVPNAAGTLNGSITSKRSLSYWLNRIAFEFRSLFKFSSAGSAMLIYRKAEPLVSGDQVKIITKSMVKKYLRRRSTYEEIINDLDLGYSRDYSTTSSEPYTAVYQASNSASKTKFGTHDKPELFTFDFVTDATNAQSSGDYYLAHYAVRHWLVEVELFLDNLELEFGDVVKFDSDLPSPLGNAYGRVYEARLAPGNKATPDGITLTVEI